MAEFFDWNPAHGTWYESEYDYQDGKITIATMQDVEPVVDFCKAKRNSDHGDTGIKRGFWHYAKIPTHVELELRQKGISIYERGQTKELLREINQNYPYLKVTNKHHA